jgi:hypothetical protein
MNVSGGGATGGLDRVDQSSTRGGGGATGAAREFISRFERGFVRATTPNLLTDVFIRGGYIDGVAQRTQERSINLTVLESAPIIGVAIGGIVHALRRAAPTTEVMARLQTPRAAADVFAIVAILLLSVFYMNNLPLYAQTTVRYLHPIYPLAIYGVFRFEPVHRLIRSHLLTVLWSYTLTVLIGTQLALVWLVQTDATFSEGVQFCALIALGIAGIATGWTAIVGGDDRFAGLGAGIVGVTAGIGTGVILLLVFALFPLEGFALPISEVVARIDI